MADDSVHRAFCPRVAILSCTDTNAIAEKNGFSCVADLLRPFESASQNRTLHKKLTQSPYARPSWSNVRLLDFMSVLICWMIFCYLETSLCPLTDCWTRYSDFSTVKFKTVILCCLLFLLKTSMRHGTKKCTSKMIHFHALLRSCTVTGLSARLIPCHTLAL